MGLISLLWGIVAMLWMLLTTQRWPLSRSYVLRSILETGD